MQLYFAPLACSLATRMALYEAGGSADYAYVDTHAKRTEDGGDYLAVNPLGQVPVLRLDDGGLLFENTAILQYVARRHPAAGLLGPDDELHLVQRWLGFVSTELHKAVFTPLFAKSAGEDAKAGAREAAKTRLEVLERHLEGRSFLTSTYTVADAYLATVLNWCQAVGLSLASWPAVEAYHKSILRRPATRKAFDEELALYKAEQSRKAA